MKLHTVDIIKDNLGSFCAGTHNPKMLRTTGRANFAGAGHINTFLLLSHWLPPLSTPLILGWGGMRKCYRSLFRKQIPGQGKGLSEGVSSVCLIERCVVNCLCVGGEKSICFLTAVTSRPWGERLELADTDTYIHTHAQPCQKPPKPCLASTNLHMHAHTLALEHTLKHAHAHSLLWARGCARGVIESG